MSLFPPTIILRHKRENLKKCSLRGLESRNDFNFLTYPHDSLPDLSRYVLLTIDAPELTDEDRNYGLFLIDATWRYAGKMASVLAAQLPVRKRSLPAFFSTAYPRRQEDCIDPQRGLASIEALFAAYLTLGRDAKDLLDLYHWKSAFLQKNYLQLLKLGQQHFLEGLLPIP